MHWSDPAIILSTRKYGETSAVLQVLTHEHGVFSGVMRGAYSKKNCGIIQAGNVVSATWNARLAEHLGTFKLELLEAHAAHIMQDAGKLAALSSACAIAELALPERHPYPKLFIKLHEFLHILNSDETWAEKYIKFEVFLLSESGFGLDLSKCAATGQTNDLIYVSPKSGRAVCREAGLPYHDKMLPLPAFLLGNGQEVIGSKKECADAHSLQISAYFKEIIAGINLTGYFLEHSLLAPNNKKLPAARIRLQNIIKE
jgi:DNA repair protein RecO (recombination protein O)